MNAQPRPEDRMRAVVDACTDCDVCRYLMPTECRLFEALYRLYDREAGGGAPISAAELRRLVDMCNYCALCACPNIRAAIVEAKTRFVAQEGLPFGTRLMTRFERLAEIGRPFSKIANAAAGQHMLGGLLKRLAGIHPERRLPAIPESSFPQWAAREGIHRKPGANALPKVAYFAGCTGRHLFPEVPQAVVQVFRHTGISVYYPEQHCCGMPTFIEGDRQQTLAWVRDTVARLAGLVEEGFAVVCACPTCGYVLKTLIRERAEYADAYQAWAGGDDQFFVVPGDRHPGVDGSQPLTRLSRAIYGKILKDDGYFAAVDPIRRIRVAENTFDAGEYLLKHIRGNTSRPVFAPRNERLVYFVPCHQREQKIGRPYLELLQAIPGLTLDMVDGPFDCCGMGGNMGFKKDFHDVSLRIAAPVIAKIKALKPEGIVTDCLSCRLQFAQMADYPVQHPMEVMAQACR